ncbi:MAG: hypothetical protein Q8N69_01780 [bacterium]|nr:hypothetical protein [bacterium]
MTKFILRKLLTGGAIVIAAQSPYFWISFYKSIFEGKPILGRKAKDTFSYLKRRGLIAVEKDGVNFSMHLTEEGEVAAGKYLIDGLYIRKSKEWDKKWRVIIFDIPENYRIKRDLFRSKLREMGFRQFQKSVWVCPYSCDKEIKLLREFFGLESKSLIILTVEKIEDDERFRKFFNL